MLKIKEYVKADSLAQAYELNQKKSNRIIGGMLMLKMGDTSIQTAIDLSGLGLDKIEETEDAFYIGCMTTLRQLELHPGLHTWTQGAVRESVRHIVGVQFRNMATVGGSIFGRFGFSDVLTMFLALDTYAELYKGGMVPLRTFIDMPKDNDILVRVIVKKKPVRCAYLSHRNTKTDFPVLACAVVRDACGIGAAVGARPAKAVFVQMKTEELEELKAELPGQNLNAEIAKRIAEQIPVGSNMRAGAAYRAHLTEVLLRRGLEQIQEDYE